MNYRDGSGLIYALLGKHVKTFNLAVILFSCLMGMQFVSL